MKPTKTTFAKRMKIRRILKEEFKGISRSHLLSERERVLSRLRVLAYKAKSNRIRLIVLTLTMTYITYA